MNTVHVAGATSKIVTVRAYVISTGLPYTAGAFNTATIAATYCRDGATPVTITLVTMTQGTWVTSGFVHRGKGVYEIGAPNAAFVTGADGVQFAIDGITDVVFTVTRVDIVGIDPRLATIPDVNVTKVNGTTQAAGDLSTLITTVAGYIDTEIADIQARLPAALTANGNMKADALRVGGTVQTAADLAALIALQASRFKKNTAFTNFVFPIMDSATPTLPKTGLTITPTRSIDGAAFGGCANAVVEIGATGFYKIDFATTDLNGNEITFKMAPSAGGLTRTFTIVTVA